MDLSLEANLPRDQLDIDYSARRTVSDAEFTATIGRYLSLSRAARLLHGTQTDLTFDQRSGQKLDLFGARPGELRPLVVFIHGGYWRALSKEHSAFMAPMLAARGIALAAPDYRLAPDASMDDIVGDCRRALAWLWHNAADLGLDRSRFVVTGSSAGGHLAAALAMPGWQAGLDLPDQALCGVLPVSGLFDLAPLAACHIQDWMKFTPEQVQAHSPLRHPQKGLPSTVALAANEAPGFFRQSRAYAEATGAAYQMIEGRHHFDVVLDFATPDSALSASLLRLIPTQGA